MPPLSDSGGSSCANSTWERQKDEQNALRGRVRRSGSQLGQGASFVVEIGEAKIHTSLAVDIRLAPQGQNLVNQPTLLDRSARGGYPDMAERMSTEVAAHRTSQHSADEGSPAILGINLGDM